MSGLDDPLSYKRYFNQHLGHQSQNREIELYDNAIAEYFAIAGIPIDYYPVEVNIDKDPVFGEDTRKKYIRKIKTTCIIDNDGFDENLLYSGFGELNNIEFKIFIHVPTFMKQVDREPIVGDQFFMPFNSSFVYEVTNSVHAALGKPGNIFGFKSCFVLNVRQREITNGSGEIFGVLNRDGTLREDAPEDALVSDGSGRVKDKYQVATPNIPSTILKDNEFIKEKVDGIDNPETEINEGGIATPKSTNTRSRWGDW